MNKSRRSFLISTTSILAFPSVVFYSTPQMDMKSAYPLLSSLASSILTKEYQRELNIFSSTLKAESVDQFLTRKENEINEFAISIKSDEINLYTQMNAYEFRSGQIVDIYSTQFSEIDLALLLVS